MAPSNSGSGSVTFKPGVRFNSVKIFSATMMAEREQLGARVTAWMHEHPGYQLTECVVTQSSDEAFHCLTITVFYVDDSAH